MANLILQTIEEENLQRTILKLRESGELLEDNICPLCNEQREKIGGFIPYEGKVVPICDKFSCILSASYVVMEFNGNGSPIIE